MPALRSREHRDAMARGRGTHEFCIDFRVPVAESVYSLEIEEGILKPCLPFHDPDQLSELIALVNKSIHINPQELHLQVSRESIGRALFLCGIVALKIQKQR